ncbi:MAG: prephenate dehydratase [Antricoccus sp.]
MPDRYAYLGPAGTFCQQALLTLTEVSGSEQIPFSGVPAVCAAVREGAADYGLVPIENSVEGPVPTTTDELVLGAPLLIVGEIFLPVSFVLAVRPGQSQSEIRSIATHPHAHAQVRQWLDRHLPNAHYTAAPSTSEAAEWVSRGEQDAVVCASIAASNQSLQVLADRIEDTAGAVTRFALLHQPGNIAAMTGNDRTTFVVHIQQERSGALNGVLSELAARSINLTRIESRPWRERIGEYHFILECEGHVGDPRVGDALAALHRVCADVRFLGSYPRTDRANETLPNEASDAIFATAAQWLDGIRKGEVN